MAECDVGAIACEFQEVTVRYPGGAIGIERVSLQVEVGKAIAVVGPMGAGKTSLLRVGAGYLPGEGVHVGGRVLLDGENVGRLSPVQRMVKGIALVPERRKILPALTVREHVRLMRRSGKLDEQVQLLVEMFPNLQSSVESRTAGLSGGQRQMLALGLAILSGAHVLLIDEPFLGLTPALSEDISGRLERLVADGKHSAVISSERMFALDWVPTKVRLEHGRIPEKCVAPYV